MGEKRECMVWYGEAKDQARRRTHYDPLVTGTKAMAQYSPEPEDRGIWSHARMQ